MSKKMKVSTTADRLKNLLYQKRMRAIDLVNKCQPYCKKYNVKIGSNDISQYLSGKVKPSQKKISILSKVLDVDEVYLMGYEENTDFLELFNNLAEEKKEKFINLIIKEIDKKKGGIK